MAAREKTIRPAGKSPGDQILEAVIPLRVDGEDVDVTVVSVWQPAASAVPAFLGYAAGPVGVVAATALADLLVEAPLLFVAARPLFFPREPGPGGPAGGRA